LNRWIEDKLLTVLDEQGVGCIAFSPLGQGLLTDRYANGVAADSRAARRNSSLDQQMFNDENLARVRGLAAIAKDRGQKMAQLAIAWALRNPVVTSVLLGASSVEQLDENLDALNNLEFTPEELTQIDEFAVESGIDLWRRPATE
jgi:L-glyceraldehyde 3-phosphate reductase